MADAAPRMMPEWRGTTRAAFDAEVVAAGRPAVLRGIVSDWPAVAAARRSPQALADYLLRFDRGDPVVAAVGPPDIAGRFFYNDSLDGFNFRRQPARLKDVLGFLVARDGQEGAPALAVQSVPARAHLAGFAEDNPMPLLPPSAEPRLWIGNRVTVAAHYDPSENIACVVAGTRRFTLFPPDQIGNLYMGPMERTPAGTTISLVDFDAPDLQRFPRFAEAMEHALVADLEPGDAIYIPYMWWHHVRSLQSVNMLVNYWWTPPAPAGAHPLDALLHAMLAIRALPERHRQAWRAHFDHYVFGAGPAAGDHLPDAVRGVLGPLDAQKAEQLAQLIMKGLRGQQD
ncbi:hypothetical protein GGR88_000855 [Sphingomonas jejuensis]|uniref:JmjC domain-containing protein n=1 Tax=Sphingomonas jejuensis TaxID=904715 RepID=A0ABX0XKX9_9SPHN|nr:cupin-like domain-containing protein [Sphingomonas jejuensis]NJC33381.1 hypothetical protein [Sphingomonas jejuensis]